MTKPFTLKNRPKLSSLCDTHQEQAQVSAAPSKSPGISPHLRSVTQFLSLTGGIGKCSYFCSLPLAQLSCMSHRIVAVNSGLGRKPSAKRNMKWEPLRGDYIPTSCRRWVSTSFYTLILRFLWISDGCGWWSYGGLFTAKKKELCWNKS